MRTRRNYIADLNAERPGRGPVQHRLDCEVSPAIVAYRCRPRAFYNLRVGGLVSHCHALDAPTVAFDELIAFIVYEVWFRDCGTTWATVCRHQLWRLIDEECPGSFGGGDSVGEL